MMFGKQFKSYRIFKRQAKALISLRVCSGWSKPLLVINTHTTLLEISSRGSDANNTDSGQGSLKQLFANTKFKCKLKTNINTFMWYP